MGKRNAFTLAEVLITLGIIGVVAAMTMPTLLNSTQAARSKTGFKKVMNVLNQALVVHNALEDQTTADLTGTSSGTDDPLSLAGLIQEKANVIKVEKHTSGQATNNYVLYFNDGMTVEFPADAKECKESAPCKGIIDTISGPDKGTMKGGALSGENVAAGSSRVKTEEITDRWPIRIHDDVVEPANAAGRIILYGKDTN